MELLNFSYDVPRETIYQAVLSMKLHIKLLSFLLSYFCKNLAIQTFCFFTKAHHHWMCLYHISNFQAQLVATAQEPQQSHILKTGICEHTKPCADSSYSSLLYCGSELIIQRFGSPGRIMTNTNLSQTLSDLYQPGISAARKVNMDEYKRVVERVRNLGNFKCTFTV